MRHELRGRKEGSRGTWGRRSRGRNMSTKERMTDSRAIKGHQVTNDSKCQGDKFGLWWNCLLNTCVHTCKSGCSWLWSEKVLILLLLPFGKDFFFLCVCLLCPHVFCVSHACSACTGHKRAWNRNCRQLWAALYFQGTDPESSMRATMLSTSELTLHPDKVLLLVAKVMQRLGTREESDWWVWPQMGHLCHHLQSSEAAWKGKQAEHEGKRKGRSVDEQSSRCWKTWRLHGWIRSNCG